MARLRREHPRARMDCGARQRPRAAERSAVGLKPAEGSLDLTGLEIGGESLKEAMAVKPEEWAAN